MKSSSVFWAIAQLSTALAATCNRDNCYRAALGTSNPMPARGPSACSSFQQCTVTPAATTVTVTSTVPGAGCASAAVARRHNAANNNAKRQLTTAAGGAAVTNCPSAVPSFASACSNSARYASACSCGGFKKGYTTGTTPTATTTATVTSTCSSASGPYFSLVVDSDTVDNGKAINIQGTQYPGEPTQNNSIIYRFIVGSSTQGLTLQRNDDGNVLDLTGDYLTQNSQASAPDYLYLTNDSDYPQFSPINCFFQPAQGKCLALCSGTDHEEDLFYRDVNGFVYLYGGGPSDSLDQINLVAVSNGSPFC